MSNIEGISASILGKAPVDSQLQSIADFLFHHVQNLITNEQVPPDQIEIEAKFGTLIDLYTSRRINFPVESDCVLVAVDDNSGDSNQRQKWFRFTSDMSREQHAHFNKTLNDLVMKQQQQTSTNDTTTPLITYKHLRETDESLQVQQQQQNGRNNIRITRDDKTNQIKRCIRKEKVANLHVFMPGRPFDCRLTIQKEIPVPIPPADTFTAAVSVMKRKKDRLSYCWDKQTIGWQLDLTQVQQIDTVTTTTHELELEVGNVAWLMKQIRLVQEGKPNAYLYCCQALWNNLQVIASSFPNNTQGK